MTGSDSGARRRYAGVFRLLDYIRLGIKALPLLTPVHFVAAACLDMRVDKTFSFTRQ